MVEAGAETRRFAHIPQAKMNSTRMIRLTQENEERAGMNEKNVKRETKVGTQGRSAVEYAEDLPGGTEGASCRNYVARVPGKMWP